jgi:hypothetical protein
VGTDRQRRFGKDRLQRRLLIDQQIARAGADENFDARRARGEFQFRHVVRRGADVKAVVDQALARGQSELFVQPLYRGRCRHGVGHFQEGRHAPLGAGPRGRVQVFLVRESRLAEVDLVVDHAGDQVQAAGRDNLIGRRVHRRVNSRNPAILD